MNAQVKITILNGSMEGAVFSYREPTECLVGRAPDCTIVVPNDLVNSEISRHHCIFEIDPPLVWVRDLVSKNGTFVNENAIEPSDNELIELHDGDQVRIGKLGLKVQTCTDVARDREFAGTADGGRALSGSWVDG